MGPPKKTVEFAERNWKWFRDNTLICDPLWDYVDKRNNQIMEGDMPKLNKLIIKEQNLASKGGKFIDKGEALRRIKKKEEENENKR